MAVGTQMTFSAALLGILLQWYSVPMWAACVVVLAVAVVLGILYTVLSNRMQIPLFYLSLCVHLLLDGLNGFFYRMTRQTSNYAYAGADRTRWLGVPLWCWIALAALALGLSTLESLFPVTAVVPVPGVKLGLANIVTVYAMFVLGPRDTLLILLSRIFLGAVFSGQMMTLLYSLGGGLLSYLALLLLRRVLGRGQLWVSSPLSAVCHNLGQLLAAAAIAKSWVVLVYLPYLVLAGLITGTLTGLCAQLVVGRLSRN